jgi:predicted nucleic acid-binding Zn ribbon protein
MAEPKPAGSGVWTYLVRPGSGLDGATLLAWASAVGEAAAGRALPWTLREGVLTVRVASSAWLQELSLRRAEILTRLAEADGQRVRELRFVVSPLES